MGCVYTSNEDARPFVFLVFIRALGHEISEQYLDLSTQKSYNLFKMFTVEFMVRRGNNVRDNEIYEEFWQEVLRAHGRAQRGIRHESSRSQREAKRMLSQNGWVDMTYFHKKQNTIYLEMISSSNNCVRDMRSDEDLRFLNCIWMMPRNVRDRFLYISQNPHRYLKFFVLLPSPEKAELFLLDNSRRFSSFCFMAMHFPSVFPVSGTWSNAPQNACRLLKEHYRKEIVENVDEYRRINFDSHDVRSSMSSIERSTIGYDRWNRLSKIYFIMFTDSGEEWREYVSYLREKGVWID